MTLGDMISLISQFLNFVSVICLYGLTVLMLVKHMLAKNLYVGQLVERRNVDVKYVGDMYQIVCW